MEKRAASNYDIMVSQAADLFLKHDQEKIIARWGLSADERYIYVPYFSREPALALDRSSAGLSYTPAYLQAHPALRREENHNNASMVIYDLLTYAPERPLATGRWASISALGGIIGAGHESTLQPKEVRTFTGRVDEVNDACARLGGEPMDKGDVSYAFTVFADFCIWFQFWDADEDFPAAVKYFFDENALAYMHYETLWYVMGDLAGRIIDEMERCTRKS